MLTEELLYRNVEKGMREAPPKLIEIYRDPFLRVVMEALILDGSRAPSKLYDDLFAISYDEADAYGPYFFDRGAFVSRIHFYHYLQGLIGNDKAVKERVFDEGWEAIDLALNRGRNVDIEDIAKEAYMRASMYALGQVRTKLSELHSLTMTGDEVRMEMSTAKLKDLLSVVKDGAKLFPKKNTDDKVDQLLFEFEQDVIKNKKEINQYHSTTIGMEVSDVGRILPTDGETEPGYTDIMSDVEDLKEEIKEKGNKRQTIIPIEYDENN